MIPASISSVRRSGRRAALLLGAATLAVPVALAAQTNNGSTAAGTARLDDAAYPEIVVTAQKRLEYLQNVPISVQALDTRKLDQLQVQNFQDYVKYLPSVSTTGSSPGSNATVVVRGIATDGGNYVQGSLPTVGIYLDEQPITTISGAVDLHIYDVARVEALAGPQGTLFGASSEAGTIRIITNKPDFTKFSGGYNLEVNAFTAGDVGGIAEGFVNEPLGEHAALRVVGFYDHAGGYIENLPSSRTYPTSGITVNNAAHAGKNYNTVDQAGGRAALALKLDEFWTVTPSIVGQYQYRRGTPSEFPARQTGDNLVTQRYGDEYGLDEFYQAGLTITGKIADFDLTYAGTYFHRDTRGNNDYADYSYFYDVLDGSGANFHDNSGKLIDPTQTFTASGASEKISQELRLATPTDWRLRGLLGVFWQQQTENFRYDYNIVNLADNLSVTGNPGTYYLDVGRRRDRDFAVFTQEDFDLTDRLTLTGGVRYYRYDNNLTDFNGTHGSQAGCIGPAIVAGAPCTSLGVVRADGSIGPVAVSGDGFTYRGNLTYKFDRDHLLYGTVSSGFRPGGANSRSTVNPGASITYGAEKLTNYEIGTKNTFWNRKATANVTVFWEEWSNIQLSVETFSALTGTGGIYTIQNAGTARSRGVEFEFGLRPIAGLSLTSASTYTDAVLTKTYNNGFSNIALAGEQLPYTPNWKSNLIARYQWNLGPFLAHLQGAAVYQSSAWNNFETKNRLFYGKRNAYTTTDLTAGVDRGAMTFEVYATNVFDTRGITSETNGCGVSTCNGDRYVIYSKPRLVGIRFGQKF